LTDVPTTVKPARVIGAANWVTLGRIAVVPLFVALAYADSDGAAVTAFFIFGLASASDKLDGYLARRDGTTSRVGAFLDPLADKLLVGAALVVLVDTRDFPLWAALVIAAREVAVQILRIRVVRAGGDLPASPAAKTKTLLQLVMVLWWLLPLEDIFWVHWTLLAAAVGSTVWSGAEYVVRTRAPQEVAR
jgi:CDP-diacylglycerol--glycerol-3-phosphate 3-phosphatidyltransferase